jgi:hypothetical protein
MLQYMGTYLGVGAYLGHYIALPNLVHTLLHDLPTYAVMSIYERRKHFTAVADPGVVPKVPGYHPRLQGRS